MVNVGSDLCKVGIRVNFQSADQICYKITSTTIDFVHIKGKIVAFSMQTVRPELILVSWQSSACELVINLGVCRGHFHQARGNLHSIRVIARHNIPFNTLSVLSETMFPADHLTGAETRFPNQLSVSMSIYIVHKHETSNALYALVRSKHKRFHMMPKCVLANSRITQVVQQTIPHCWTSHRESPSGGGA